MNCRRSQSERLTGVCQLGGKQSQTREMAEQGQPVSLLELHRTGAQQDSTAGNTKQGERVTKAVQGSLGDTLVIGTGRVVGVVTHLLLLDCENQQRGSSRGWGCLLQLCSTCDLSPLHRT